ncbi:MAG TPA: hypothetical protein VE619_01915 [Nitrososphaeraceae archaeon]|nr:hypothetical protein [Nitrososphaeraceae archaeon]
MNHTIMAIAVFSAIASLLAAANLYSTHAYASVLTHPIRSHFSLEGLQTKSGHKSQHLNQENVCYRTVICNNSNVALQTLGNDNSVTGFADQSGNFQQNPEAGTGQKDSGSFQQTPAANMITGAGSGFNTSQLK